MLFKKWLYFLVCLSLSTVSVAGDDQHLFNPAKQDISIEYLGKIFGNISPVLSNVTDKDSGETLPGIHGDTRLLGNMFLLFNKVALLIGIFIVIYIILIGSIQSAGSGKILGERWSGAFLPLRSVFGMMLLIPSATGYCLAQVIVMWLVYHGVGAADTVWSSALKYIKTGHSVYSDVNKNALHDLTQYQQNVQPVNHFLSRVYEAVTCNVRYQQANNQFNQQIKTNGNQSSNIVTGVQYDDMKHVSKLYYGVLNADDDNINFKKICGEIDLSMIPVQNTREQLASAITQTSGMMASLVPEPGKVQTIDSNANASLYNAIFDFFYSSIQQEVSEDSTVKEINTNINDYGWILAGNYYRWLSQQNASLNKQKTYIKSLTVVNTCSQSTQSYCNEATPAYHSIQVHAEALRAQEHAQNNAQDYFDKNKLKDGVTIKSMHNAGLDFERYSVWFFTLGVGYGLEQLMNPIVNGISGEFDALGDPFASAVAMGTQMMELATFLATFSLIMGNIAFGMIAAICSGVEPLQHGSQTVRSVISSMVLGVCGFLYMQGAMLAIYLPLIPFVIFIFGVLGWFITVIEAMVAAPLIALGLMWPDGQNEIWGRAEPALFMLLNLFLRPALMVFGLITGILLCWIGFKLAQLGFRFFLSHQLIGFEPTFGWLPIGFVYAMLLISIAKKSFSLVHHLPDSVLKWIGDNSPGLGGADEFTQSLQGGVDKGGGAMGGVHGQIGSFKGWQGADMISTSTGGKGWVNNAKDKAQSAGKAISQVFQKPGSAAK